MNYRSPGVSFEAAYECTPPEIDRILNAFGEPHDIDVLYHSDQISIMRLLVQTQSGRIRVYRIMYAAHLEGTDRYIVTCGTIRTARMDKLAEYEKTGKQKLYEATRAVWNIRY